MSTATTTRPSPPQNSWPARSRSRGSIAKTPMLSPNPRPLHSPHDPRTPSPSYFGFVADSDHIPTDSTAAGHVKKNWNETPTRPHTVSPHSGSRRRPPTYEAFRRESESKVFNLSHGNLSHFGSAGSGAGKLPTLGSLAERDGSEGISPSITQTTCGNIGEEHPRDDPMDVDTVPVRQKSPSQTNAPNAPSFFDAPRRDSPASISVTDLPNLQRNQLIRLDARHPRLSLPHNRVDQATPAGMQRSETLPETTSSDSPTMISPDGLMDLFMEHSIDEILLLDLRVFPQYAQSRLKGAMNLCIPTTLLKRPSFNVQKLADTFTRENEKNKFARWRQIHHIVVYDASSAQLKDATACVNTLKKFTSEGWHGLTYIIRGGFAGFSKKFRDMIDIRSGNQTEDSTHRPASIDLPGIAPVAGGCPMPGMQTAANPFFGNIRQNMDLIGGVGQMPIKQPAGLSLSDLPVWLRRISDKDDKGKAVASRFLKIERAEQQRMQQALSANVSYGSPTRSSAKNVQIAGIEKGTKNRYKDMLPYDHSRVRLQDVPSGECDYVNASHVKAEWSNRRYIASQAPVPTTFEDFWRVVWEQDARVILMLTAESEGGQCKSHPYWVEGTYGPLRLKTLSEKRVALAPLSTTVNTTSAPLDQAMDRPVTVARRSTQPISFDNANPTDPSLSETSETPHVIIRKMTLSHTLQAFQPLREITQLQYSSWPDFGTPAHPAQVLELVEHCNEIIRRSNNQVDLDPNLPVAEDERPVVVHCSAGCGRTGTFCTIDSVLDILRKRRLARCRKVDGEMDVDEAKVKPWLERDDVDLVTKTVEDFRESRLSMVQTLRQFVLCYETVLEWIGREKRKEASEEEINLEE